MKRHENGSENRKHFELEFCLSQLTCLLYSQNIQLGPPLVDHMGGTCAHHYPHIKFCHCSPCRTQSGNWPFELLANQNRYVKEVLNICIRWGQIQWEILVPTTTHILVPSFMKISHCVFFFFFFFRSEGLLLWLRTNWHTSMCSYKQITWQQKS